MERLSWCNTTPNSKSKKVEPSTKTEEKRKATTTDIVVALVAILSLVVSGCSAYVLYQDNIRQSDFESTIARLLANQTILQGNISQFFDNLNMLQSKNNDLLANQTDLQKQIFDLQNKIFSLQNPTPNVTILSVEPILIGPPSSSQISVTPTGVSFEFNGTIFLNLRVFISTQHAGALTIPHNSLSLTPTYNVSQIWVGFSTSGISSEDYFEPIDVQTQVLAINISCQTFYRFTDSHILNYPSFDIGYVGFSLTFNDQWTNTTYSQNGQASFGWNNSTAMP